MLYGCVTWSPRARHYGPLRLVHNRFLTRCIGWPKNNRTDHPISYLDTLMRMESESIEATVRRRWILFVDLRCARRTRCCRRPRHWENWWGARVAWGGQEKEWTGCLLDDLSAFGINASQWTTAWTRENVVGVVVVASHVQRIGCQPEKTTLHGRQSRSWSAEQGKGYKREILAAQPPTLAPVQDSSGSSTRSIRVASQVLRFRV